MGKRVLMVCLVAVLCLPGGIFAEEVEKAQVADEGKVFTGRAVYQNIRAFLDFVADVMDGLGLRYQDARVSPIVQADRWYEVPMELCWIGTQDSLAPLLEKLSAFSFADSRFSFGSISVSCSAETREDGQVFLTVTANVKVMCGNPAGWGEVVSKRNLQIIRAFRSLLETTTFTPQVRKKVVGGGVGPGKTWLTNLRIDSDYRVQITGYALGVKEVTLFGDALSKTGSFVEVFLSNMNRNTYEKIPVWRFDITSKVN